MTNPQTTPNGVKIPEEYSFAFTAGWNAALNEVLEVFAGDENWKLNIRKIVTELKHD